MDNGCPKCEELSPDELCLNCQLGRAEYEAMFWMDEIEKLKQKIQEKKDESNSKTRAIH